MLVLEETLRLPVEVVRASEEGRLEVEPRSAVLDFKFVLDDKLVLVLVLVLVPPLDEAVEVGREPSCEKRQESPSLQVP